MKKSTVLSFIAMILCVFVNAQDKQKALRDFEKQTHATVSLNYASDIEFIRFPADKPMKIAGASLEAKVQTFLENHKEIFGLSTVQEAFKVLPVKTDKHGLNHVVLKQQHQGVTVFSGQLRFHFNKSNALTAINGNVITVDKKIKTEPILTSSQAKAIALQTVAEQGINYSGYSTFVFNTDMFIFQKGLIQNTFGSQYLVYEVEVRNDKDVREFLYINAHTGELVEQFTGMAHAIDRVVHESSIGNIVWEEGDVFPGALSVWQQNEVVASEHVYNFFNNAFGYVSFDGADGQMVTLNNSTNFSCPNARWNGSFAEYCDGTAADDVIAHEWGHAYTQYTSGLIYAYQSGAINESYSDIWGETIDILNNFNDFGEDLGLRSDTCRSTDRWIIAEDATSINGGNGLRDMWNPTCYGNPGKVSDEIQYSCGDFDNGGVHINSGIPNHAYALLVDGGTYNGQTVTGIGFTKAAHIFWRAQSEYLTPTSDFLNLADALEASCTDLIGVNLEGLTTNETAAGLSGEIITVSDYNQLVNALLAVEIRMEPTSCDYEPILATTSDPCDAATDNAIFFEDWESGIGTWTVEQLPENALTWESRDWEVVTGLPDNRAGQAAFGVDPVNGNCSTSFQNGIIRLQSPVITMPDYTDGDFEMSFMHYIATESKWDGANIKYSLNGGLWTLVPLSAFTQNGYNDFINPQGQGNDNPMAGEAAFTGADQGSLSGSWGRSFINLSSIGVEENATIQFRFEVGTDGCNGVTGWFVDDLAIYNCNYPLSVAEYNVLDNSIKVYPNPSNGIFTLNNTGNITLIQASVYDINGRIIKTVKLNNNSKSQQLDLTGVASGMYFMKVKSSNAEKVIKLIKE